AKGTCTPRLLAAVLAEADRHAVPVLIDPARIADYSRYRGAALVTPNRVEAELAGGRPMHIPEDALAAGRGLCDQHGFEAVLIKLDRDGMALVRAGAPGRLLPTRQRLVYDVT